MNELIEAARYLVEEFGGTGSLSTNSPATYNPETGIAVGSKIVQSVKAALLDLTLQSNGLSLRYGTEVLTGDKEAYVIPPELTGGVPVTFTPGVDTLTFEGVAYTIVTFKEANPGAGSAFVYFLYLRR